MPIVVNNQVIALKLIAALYMQGKVSPETYSQILKKYGTAQGGTKVGLPQSA